jgi:hypothetical protein
MKENATDYPRAVEHDKIVFVPKTEILSRGCKTEIGHWNLMFILYIAANRPRLTFVPNVISPSRRARCGKWRRPIEPRGSQPRFSRQPNRLCDGDVRPHDDDEKSSPWHHIQGRIRSAGEWSKRPQQKAT